MRDGRMLSLIHIFNEQEVTMKQFRREATAAVSDFLHEVNHKLVGDCVSMSNE